MGLHFLLFVLIFIAWPANAAKQSPRSCSFLKVFLNGTEGFTIDDAARVYVELIQSLAPEIITTEFSEKIRDSKNPFVLPKGTKLNSNTLPETLKEFELIALEKFGREELVGKCLARLEQSIDRIGATEAKQKEVSKKSIKTRISATDAIRWTNWVSGTPRFSHDGSIVLQKTSGLGTIDNIWSRTSGKVEQVGKSTLEFAPLGVMPDGKIIVQGEVGGKHTTWNVHPEHRWVVPLGVTEYVPGSMLSPPSTYSLPSLTYKGDSGNEPKLMVTNDTGELFLLQTGRGEVYFHNSKGEKKWTEVVSGDAPYPEREIAFLPGTNRAYIRHANSISLIEADGTTKNFAGILDDPRSVGTLSRDGSTHYHKIRKGRASKVEAVELASGKKKLFWNDEKGTIDCRGVIPHPNGEYLILVLSESVPPSHQHRNAVIQMREIGSGTEVLEIKLPIEIGGNEMDGIPLYLTPDGKYLHVQTKDMKSFVFEVQPDHLQPVNASVPQ